MAATNVSLSPVVMFTSWRSRVRSVTGTSGGVGSVTVTTQESEISFAEVAVMVAVPAFIAVILPFSSTATTVLSLELQATLLSVALSGVMAATNVSLSPVVMFTSWRSRVRSVTGTSGGVGSVTVTTQESEILFAEVAVMVAVPAFIAVMLPFSSTATTVLSLELQATLLSVALSGVMVAVNVSLSPVVILTSWRSRVRPVTGTSGGMGSVTVTTQESEIPFAEVAVMVAVPAFIAVILPFPSMATTV